MLGTVIKYVGRPIDERYENFMGHVGYVTHSSIHEATGARHVAVTWFEPLPVHSGRKTSRSHFGLERFEILSDPLDNSLT